MRPAIAATAFSFFLIFAWGCSSSSQSGQPNNITTNNAATTSTANANSNAPAAAPRPVPASLTNVGEYAENIYDAAQAKNWKTASAKLTSLQNAAGQLEKDLASTSSSVGITQLQADIAEIQKDIPARNQIGIMDASNDATRAAAQLTTYYQRQTPMEVTMLDYYGRELQIGVAKKDMNMLKKTATDIKNSWDSVKASVESKGGSAVAKKFDSTVSQIDSAKLPRQFARLANTELNQVDDLEKVFSK